MKFRELTLFEVRSFQEIYLTYVNFHPGVQRIALFANNGALISGMYRDDVLLKKLPAALTQLTLSGVSFADGTRALEEAVSESHNLYSICLLNPRVSAEQLKSLCSVIARRGSLKNFWINGINASVHFEDLMPLFNLPFLEKLIFQTARDLNLDQARQFLERLANSHVSYL